MHISLFSISLRFLFNFYAIYVNLRFSYHVYNHTNYVRSVDCTLLMTLPLSLSQVLKILKRKDEMIISLQKELQDSTNVRVQTQRELQLAIPSPESTLLECSRLKDLLSKEIAEHLTSKNEIATLQNSITSMKIMKSEMENDLNNQIIQYKKCDIEVKSLREVTADQSEQIQVRMKGEGSRNRRKIRKRTNQ